MKSSRRRKQSVKSILAHNTNEFCQNSTLHGLKYITNKDLYPLERIYFTVAFILVVAASAYFISNVYTKWNTTPVIIGLNPVPTFITRAPFPAVTICNMNQALKSKVQNFSVNSIEYSMLQLLCNRDINVKNISNTTTDWRIFDKFIIDISQPCNRMLRSCSFGSIDYSCSDIVKPVLTDEGMCCAFNIVNPSFMYVQDVANFGNVSYSDGSVPIDWNPEKGYPNKLPRKFYPRVAAGTGESFGFTVTLDVELEEYYCSSSNGAGFKIVLHSPIEIPHVKEIGLLLAAGMETKIRIKADKTEASYGIRDIRQESRGCLFENEQNLLYYSYYNKRNCEMECDAKLLAEKCHCVSHYMPRIYPNLSICGIRDADCVHSFSRQNHLSNDYRVTCHDNCKPSCFDLTFLPDFFSAPIAHKGFNIQHQLIENISNEYATKNIAIAHMYFKENTYRSNIKTEFIGMTDFLSNTGGLMGLFMGFSFISLAEFIYYAIIRPVKILKEQRSKVQKSNGPIDNRDGKESHVVARWATKTDRKRYNFPSRIAQQKRIPLLDYETIGTISKSLENKKVRAGVQTEK